MTYMQRHLDMQETDEHDLPAWARELDWTPERYNVLAATLQSNVARHAEGGGLILNPMIRLCNHSCEPNTEICWDPTDAQSCECGLGHYLLRVSRPIGKGEELTFSYIGEVLCEDTQAEDRGALLTRRWGFACLCGMCTRQLATGHTEGRACRPEGIEAGCSKEEAHEIDACEKEND